MSEERKRDSGRFTRETDVEETRGSAASRARNRTVLLTPETVGQVRASMTEDEASSDPLTDLLPPVGGGWDYTAEGSGPQIVGRNAAGEEEFEDEPQPQFDARGSNRGFSRPPGAGFNALRGREPAAPATARGSKTPTASEKRPPIPVGFEEDRAPKRAARARVTSRIVGFLISFDASEHGDVYELRVGRWLVTSRPIEHGEYMLIDDDTISPMHAVIRATADGKVQVLDQLSEHGSAVARAGSEDEEEISGTTVSVQHGDVVRFGQRRFVICLVPKSAEVASEDEE